MEVGMMFKTEGFRMMVEGFMEHAKQQEADLVEGAVMAFIPRGGDASTVSILSWVPNTERSDPSTIWQEAFVAMVWTLMAAGLSLEDLHDTMQYAAQFYNDMNIETQSMGGEEVEN
jgi:hypothetical protein